MKIYPFLILFSFGLSSFGYSQTNSINDSIEAITAYGKVSSKDVALGVIEFLRNADTSQYLKLTIPLEGKKQIVTRDLELKHQKEYLDTQLDAVEDQHSSSLENFLVRSGYIHEIMIEDKNFEITKAEIDTLIVKKLPANMFRGRSFPKENWNMVTVIMEYKKEKFYFEIPQIVELDERWFLYYPEYYLRDQKELDFVNSIRNE